MHRASAEWCSRRVLEWRSSPGVPLLLPILTPTSPARHLGHRPAHTENRRNRAGANRFRSRNRPGAAGGHGVAHRGTARRPVATAADRTGLHRDTSTAPIRLAQRQADRHARIGERGCRDRGPHLRSGRHRSEPRPFEPAHGSVAILDGKIVYTPDCTYAHNLAAGGSTTPGSDEFTVTVSDGHGGSDAEVVNVVVQPLNQKPGLVYTTVFERHAVHHRHSQRG